MKTTKQKTTLKTKTAIIKGTVIINLNHSTPNPQTTQTTYKDNTTRNKTNKTTY